MRPKDWLVAQPIAHRGLHDASAGIIENTPSSVAAAIDAGYGAEVDLQISADGEAMVYHDDNLGRLTEGSAALTTLTAAQIKAAPFKATSDRIMTLGELLELAAGRSTLLIELKSRFDGDLHLVRRAAKLLTDYKGPAAVMSFDPHMIEALRAIAPNIRRGITAEQHYDSDEWSTVPDADIRSMKWFLHAPHTRPQFVAYSVNEIGGPYASVWRDKFGPMLTWTVRDNNQRQSARRFADQMIFEGFRPPV